MPIAVVPVGVTLVSGSGAFRVVNGCANRNCRTSIMPCTDSYHEIETVVNCHVGLKSGDGGRGGGGGDRTTRAYTQAHTPEPATYDLDPLPVCLLI